MADLWLVTGGAGFIGSNLVRALLEEGRSVRVLDNFATGFRENLQEVAGDVDLVEGDIRDADTCRRASAGAEVVCHQAAIPSVPRSMEDPQGCFDANVVGTHNMLMAARDAGVRRFIFAASSSAYGAGEELPKRETMPVLPVSPYAAAKAAGELLVATWHRAFGLETVSLRYFNVFGPHQDSTNQYAGVIAAFATRMLRGRRPVIYGDGTQSRDFTFVENVVRANLLAAEAPEVHGEVVNIGCGEAIDLNQMVRDFNKVLGIDLEPIYEAPRPGDVKHSLADVSAARDLLGYEPQVFFADGLRRTIDWYRWALETGYGGWAAAGR
ncbi:MAG TPA: SDR family oxidoreductase [Phycisphaerae bacterium]|nr:SDR family oxidoreductase [Phycisphaerae bacterium]HUX16091.1 SDR family oxidoreductase [Phycisphaerae bacterium]